MIKKILTIAISASLFILFSCGTAHNDDNTNVDRTGGVSAQTNTTANDSTTSPHHVTPMADSSGNNTAGASGVNNSRVRK